MFWTPVRNHLRKSAFSGRKLVLIIRYLQLLRSVNFRKCPVFQFFANHLRKCIMLIFTKKNEKNMQKCLHRSKKNSTFAKIIAKQTPTPWQRDSYTVLPSNLCKTFICWDTDCYPKFH